MGLEFSFPTGGWSAQYQRQVSRIVEEKGVAFRVERKAVPGTTSTCIACTAHCA